MVELAHLFIPSFIWPEDSDPQLLVFITCEVIETPHGQDRLEPCSGTKVEEHSIVKWKTKCKTKKLRIRETPP